MLVCHCMAVYESDVRAEIDDGACDVFAVAEASGAGTGCGGCVPTLCRMLGQEIDPEACGPLLQPAR